MQEVLVMELPWEAKSRAKFYQEVLMLQVKLDLIFFIAIHAEWNRESVAGSVIQATGMVEFEDGSPPLRLLVSL